MLALVAAIQAAVAAPGFAPPLDVPLRVTVTRSVAEGGSTRAYRTERRIRFRREENGALVAEVTLLAAEADSPEAWAGLFEAGFAALSGETLLLRLDDEGHVVAVDDLARRWARFCDGIAGMAASRHVAVPDAERAALIARIVAPLRALPPARQRAAFASLVTELIAGDGVSGPLGVRQPVQVTGRTHFGSPVALQGVRHIAREAGALVETTEAQGEFAAPEGGADGALVRTTRTVVTPETGLVRSHSETQHTRIGSGEGAREMTRETTVEITAE